MKYDYEKDVEKFEKEHGKVKFTQKLLNRYKHCKKINNKVEMTPLEYEKYLKEDAESVKHVMDLLGSKKNYNKKNKPKP